MAGNDAYIAGIGSINVDLIFSGLEKLPNEGEEIYSKDFSVELGGGVPAVLINASRLGVPVKMATRLGSDIFSKFASSELSALNIEHINLYNGGNIPVNISCSAVTKSDRTFLSYGETHIYDENEIHRAYEVCTGAKIVLMIANKSLLSLYKKLKDEGSILIFDCGWDDNMNLSEYDAFLQLADYYLPNRKEALKITGTDKIEDATEILKKYFEKVIIKLDKDGCFGMEKNEKFIISPDSNTDFVDPTGAGDAFLAGFAYGIFHDRPLKQCISFGNLTGGRSVAGIGCLKTYLTEKELLDKYKEIYKE